MTNIYSRDSRSTIRPPPEPIPHDGLTGRDGTIISEALRTFIAVQLRSGETQAQSDAQDALAILFVHCGCDPDYFALHFPELAGRFGSH